MNFKNTALALGAVLLIGLQILPALTARAAAPDNIIWTPRNNGISGSNVVGLAVDPTATSTVYALTGTSGVFKTTNAGTGWSAVNTGLPADKTVNASHLFGNLLTIDPRDPGILYANFDGKPFKTTNGGTSWTEISTGLDACSGNYGVTGIAVDPRDSDHLLAGYIVASCTGGLFESANGGTSWSHVIATGITNDAWMVAFDSADSDNLFLATIHIGFAYSTDGGLNWTINNPAGAGTEGTAVAVHPVTTSRILYGDEDTGLYLSTDAGLTWTDKTSEVPEIVRDIKFASSSPDIGYIAATGGVYKTTDGGLNWAAVGSHAAKNPYTLAVDLTNPDTVFLGSSSSGIYKSTDGGATFTAVNTGIPISINIGSLTVAPSDSDIFYAAARDLGFFRSTDRGYNWTKMSSAVSTVNNTNYILVSPTDPDIIYAGFGQIYKSTDAGATFNLSFDPGGEHFMQAAAIDPGNADHVIVSDSNTIKAWRSLDAGATWATSTTLLPAGFFNRIIFDPTDTDRVYAGTLDYFWKSVDNGATWTQVTSTLNGANDNQIDSIALDPSSPNIIYAGTRGDHVMKSTDYGDTWAATSYDSVGATTPQSLRTNSDGNVYAFTLYGLQESTDQGGAWSNVATSGLTSSFYVPKFNFTIDPADSDRLLVGDFFSGVNIFENYVPVFGSSNVVATNDFGGSQVSVGDIFTATTTVTNSGTASAVDTMLSVTLPTDLEYVAGSSKIDNGAVADPASVSTLQYDLGDLSTDQSVTVAFRFTVNDSGTLSARVTSNEDVAGTSAGSVGVSMNRSASLAIGGSAGIAGPSAAGAPAAPSAPASNAGLLAQIAALTAQIAELQARLGISPGSGSPGGATPGGLPAGVVFDRDLTIGATGPDVRALQQFLNTKGFAVAAAGPGSPGAETDFFGALTRAALARFQAANNISPAVGYFGPLTRAFIAANQ